MQAFVWLALAVMFKVCMQLEIHIVFCI